MWFRNRQKSEKTAEAAAFFEPAVAAGPALPQRDVGFTGQAPGRESGTALRTIAPSQEDRSYPVPAMPPLRTRPPSRNLVRLDDPLSAAGSAYSRLGARLMRQLEEIGCDTVAITAPRGRMGAGSTAINLATSLARDGGRTVILLEFDVINPTLCARLGFEPRMGFVDYLRNDTPLGHLTFDLAARLVVLPAGQPDPGAKMLLSSPKMARLMETLRARYENPILILDVPSWLVGTNPVAFTRLTDCVLLVVDEDATRMEDVRRVVNLLKPSTIAGIILNTASRTDELS